MMADDQDTDEQEGRVMPNKNDKTFRGNASQFFVAGELCRRNLVAVVTLGNTPNTDILCSNPEGTKFVHIQVKTFVPGNRTVSVGQKAERFYGDNFFWVLGGIPTSDSGRDFEYYIIPSRDVADHVKRSHAQWLQGVRPDGEARQDSKVRTIHLPPRTTYDGWSIEQYLNRWDLIESLLR